MFIGYAVDTLTYINSFSEGEIPDVYYHPLVPALFALKDAGVLVEDDQLLMLESLFASQPRNVPCPSSAEDFIAVYFLCNGGILTGNDEYGTFTPLNTITRSEVAGIISRVVEPSLRRTVVLQKKPSQLTPIDRLPNLESLRKKMSDTELAQAYEAARAIVEPLANLPRESQLCGIALYDKPTSEWDFHSLLPGIQMMFSFMLTDDTKPLRLCK